MATKRRRGKKLNKFYHYTFDAGENKGEAPTFLSKSELDRVLNMELRANGLSTRYGSSILTVDGSGLPNPIVGNPRIRDITSLRYATSDTVLFTANDEVRLGAAAPVAIRTGLDTTARTTWQVVNEDVYGSNGVDRPFFFDPDRSTTATYTAGYQTPAAFTATPQVAGGSMTAGTYSYYATLYDLNTETESNIQSAPVTAAVVGPTSSVDLTNLPIDPENRSTHWRIYRKDPLGFYHFRIAQVTYNAGLPNYTDTFALTGSKYLAPDDNDRPDISQVVVKHENNMFYLNGSLATWSKAFRFQNVPTYNRELVQDTSANFEAAVSYRGALVMWKTDTTYVLKGDVNSGDYVIKKIADVGTYSPRSIAVSPDGIYFLDNFKTPRLINSTDFEAEDLRDSTDISYKYKKQFEQIQESDLEFVTGHIWETSDRKQYRLYVPVNPYKSGSFNNHCFVFDYALSKRNQGQSAWFDFQYSINISCATVHAGTSRTRKIYAGDDYGLIWELDFKSRFDDGVSLFREETNGVLTYGVNTLDISAFAATPNAHVGQQLIIYAANRYTELFRSRITANTATLFTLEDAFPAAFPADAYVVIGGYKWFFGTSNFTYDRAGRNHSWKMSVLFSLAFVQSQCQVFTHYDFNQVFNYTYDYINNPANASLTPLADNYTLQVSAGLPRYDISRYGAANYSIALYGTNEFLLRGKYPWQHVSWGMVCRAPQNPFEYLGSTLYYRPGGLLT